MNKIWCQSWKTSVGIQPKMSPSVSFSCTQWKQFLLCRKRTNSWYGAHMYFLTCFSTLYVVWKIGLSNIRYFFNTHLFSNDVIMTLNYVLCHISVQNLENAHFVGIYIYSLHQHTSTINSTIQWNHLTTLPLYHLHTANIGRRISIRGWLITVRDIATLI